ncbi:hypothetical protein PRIPAC_72382, partial [Pristionchus pacificus]|uniref:Uncharacterized protein n=1 Tax=Pristionchus pacificus TaxID=54126 RepID=A0A2A6CGH1_PRIPA
KNFYEELFSPKVSIAQPNLYSTENLPPFTLSEISNAINSLKFGHAAGIDRILPDMLRISRDAAKYLRT